MDDRSEQEILLIREIGKIIKEDQLFLIKNIKAENEKLRARAERAEMALAETVKLLKILGVDKIPEDIREILDGSNEEK